ncbi:MAG: replicative DNA helicase [Haliscomenobacter sp.]
MEPSKKKPEPADPAQRGAKSRREDLSNFVFGKVPPQAIPLEEAVLGAVMLEKDALSVVLDILQPESFYLDAHQLIYRAMLELFEKSYPIDLLTVTEALKKAGKLDAIGGPYYLVELTNKVASAANVEYHARIISQKFIQRELIRVSTNIIRSAYEETTDVFDLLDEAEQGLFAIAEKNMSRGYQTMGALASKALKQIEELKDKEEGLTGVPTGFTALDRLTSGWQPSDLIIIAARPGMGKTSFVLSLAKNAAMDYNKGIALFSLEMSALQLAQRLISMESEITLSNLRTGKLQEYERQQLRSAIERIGNAPIYLDDTPGINIFELRAKCRRMKLQYDIQLIVIDYLQLMSGGGENQRGNREQEVSAISRALKSLAKELQVPVIALSQLSRAVEVRGGSKRPQLSDLRESGSIEQDADIVSFIFRPEYYQMLEDDNGASLKGIAEIIVAKHRNGATDTVKLRFTDQFARFSNLDDPDFGSFPGDVFNTPVPAPTGIITRSSRMNDDEDIPF